MGSTLGIRCGGQSCASTAQVCCSSDKGLTGTCRFVQQGCQMGLAFGCDGPEDCAPAEPVCCAQNGQSSCQAACGTSGGVAYPMCQRDADCGDGVTVRCCPDPSGAYKLCLPPPCPT
jgi:hypothetical protein